MVAFLQGNFRMKEKPLLSFSRQSNKTWVWDLDGLRIMLVSALHLKSCEESV